MEGSRIAGNSAQRLRIAVVGVGTYEHSRARGYLAVLTQLGDRYDLCALCDSGAEALRKAGDEAQAAEYLSRLLERYPDSRWAERAARQGPP